MSGPYSEHRLPPTTYSLRKELDDFSCDQKCICKYTNNRSPYDELQYNHYVLGKPTHLTVENNIPNWKPT